MVQVDDDDDDDDATIGHLVNKLRPLVSREELSLWEHQGQIVTLVGLSAHLGGLELCRCMYGRPPGSRSGW